MPEIGETLREARIRQRVEISEVEERTKIRAKYLRALENEEWEALPGPTFVKSFLRTYAEELGLDARLLLEEYKLRFERLSEQELAPIAPPGRREPRRSRHPTLARDVLVAVLVVALVALFIVLGRGSSGGGGTPTLARTPTATTRTAPARSGRGSRARTTPARPRRVALSLLATAPVYVCLKAGGRVLVRERTLAAGERTRTFRARSFRLLLGNDAVRLRVNGRTLPVGPSSRPIAYAITARGRRPIPASPSAICA